MNIKDRNISIKFANCDKWITLTRSQYDTVFGRDLLLSKSLGLTTDIYLSLLYSDYPIKL